MELFTHSIRIAVREGVEEGVKAGVSAALSEVRSDERKKDQPVPYGNRKLRRPQNWDEICEGWRSGKVSTSKAAEMAGMSRTSFCSYATGKKTF